MPILNFLQLSASFKNKDINALFNNAVVNKSKLMEIVSSYDLLSPQDQVQLLKTIPTVEIVDAFLKFHAHSGGNKVAEQNIRGELTNRQEALYNKLSNWVVAKKEENITIKELVMLSGEQQIKLFAKMDEANVTKIYDTFKTSDRKNQDLVLNTSLLSDLDRRQQLGKALEKMTPIEPKQFSPRINAAKRAAVISPFQASLVNPIVEPAPQAQITKPPRPPRPAEATLRETIVIPKGRLAYDDNLKFKEFLHDLGKYTPELKPKKDAPISSQTILLNSIISLYDELIIRQQTATIEINAVQELRNKLNTAISTLSAKDQPAIKKNSSNTRIG